MWVPETILILVPCVSRVILWLGNGMCRCQLWNVLRIGVPCWWVWCFPSSLWCSCWTTLLESWMRGPWDEGWGQSESQHHFSTAKWLLLKDVYKYGRLAGCTSFWSVAGKCECNIMQQVCVRLCSWICGCFFGGQVHISMFGVSVSEFGGRSDAMWRTQSADRKLSISFWTSQGVMEHRGSSFVILANGACRRCALAWSCKFCLEPFNVLCFHGGPVSPTKGMAEFNLSILFYMVLEKWNEIVL